MKKEEAKIRDYIIKLAEERGALKYSDFKPEDRKVWEYLFSEVERDGYISYVRLTSAIWPEITGKGILFLDEGRYSGLSRSERISSASCLFGSLFNEIGKIAISNLISGK